MIRQIRVTNFKSIQDLRLDLGRLTVLIGANGSGKSNILEAIAFAAAASLDKLDNEFLITRGIRVTDTRFMRSAFGNAAKRETEIIVRGDNDVEFHSRISAIETDSYPKWTRAPVLSKEDTRKILQAFVVGDIDERSEEIRSILADVVNRVSQRRAGTLPGFLIFAPENSVLRTFQTEGQILPLGIRGEGLFAHLKALNSATHKGRLAEIRKRLSLIDWFEDFDIPDDLRPGERSMRIRDRHLPEGATFDQRSANEGFLFLLFYLTLFISPETPPFFAVDNVDTSLNPKLCLTLVRQITELAKEFDKQVILTTHSPAILDGLDLRDDEQRLVVVDRNRAGHTVVRRVDPPKPVAGQPAVNLSEAFVRGYIGGLPKNF